MGNEQFWFRCIRSLFCDPYTRTKHMVVVACVWLAEYNHFVFAYLYGNQNEFLGIHPYVKFYAYVNVYVLSRVTCSPRPLRHKPLPMLIQMNICIFNTDVRGNYDIICLQVEWNDAKFKSHPSFSTLCIVIFFLRFL